MLHVVELAGGERHAAADPLHAVQAEHGNQRQAGRRDAAAGQRADAFDRIDEPGHLRRIIDRAGAAAHDLL